MKRHPRCERSPLLCPLDGCEERFNDKRSLRDHIDIHYGKTPERRVREKRPKIKVVQSKC